MKIWMPKKTREFGGAEFCPVCKTVRNNNEGYFPFNMCMNDHEPIAMIRIHQQKGHFPIPKQTRWSGPQRK